MFSILGGSVFIFFHRNHPPKELVHPNKTPRMSRQKCAALWRRSRGGRGGSGGEGGVFCDFLPSITWKGGKTLSGGVGVNPHRILSGGNYTFLRVWELSVLNTQMEARIKPKNWKNFFIKK